METSLKALGLDYVDLLLIHWPQPKVPFTETLGALAKAKRSGMTLHIGVSNFTLAMLDKAVRVCPEPLVTNQIEYHAYLPQDRMIGALKTYGMILTAYCPVARGKLLDDPVIGEIAKARGKTHAQICLRWLVQQPMVAAVPRALEEPHIVENLDVFDFSLTNKEMQRTSAYKKEHSHRGSPERAPKWDIETGPDIQTTAFLGRSCCNVTASFRPSAALKCVADQNSSTYDMFNPRPRHQRGVRGTKRADYHSS